MAEEVRYEVDCSSRLMGTESFCFTVLTFIRSLSINSLVMSHKFLHFGENYGALWVREFSAVRDTG